MADQIMTDIQVVGAGANYDIQPAAGFEWEVLAIGSSVWVGVATAAVPQVNVGIFNGAIGPAWVLQSTDVRGWYRRLELLVNNTNYIRLNNPGGGGANISFTAKIARSYGSGVSRVVTQLAAVGAAANWDIQPAAGFEYLIKDIGASLWIGGAPAALPDVTVSIFDGAIGADVLQGANIRGWNKNLKLYLNNGNYLRLNNTNAAQNILAVVGEVARMYGAGAIVVMTDVQTLGAGANWDVRPPAGQEWVIYDIGAGTWVGVAGVALPDLTVSLFDGVNASILMQSTDVKGWNEDMEVLIDNTDYLRINDNSGAGQNVGISAVLARQFTG